MGDVDAKVQVLFGIPGQVVRPPGSRSEWTVEDITHEPWSGVRGATTIELRTAGGERMVVHREKLVDVLPDGWTLVRGPTSLLTDQEELEHVTRLHVGRVPDGVSSSAWKAAVLAVREQVVASGGSGSFQGGRLRMLMQHGVGAAVAAYARAERFG